jgi:hypothetical protein
LIKLFVTWGVTSLSKDTRGSLARLHLSLAYILVVVDGVVEDTVGADVVGVGAAQDADH